MKRNKKIISVLLAVIMMLSALPLTSVGSFADAEYSFTELLTDVGTFSELHSFLTTEYKFNKNGKVTVTVYSYDGPSSTTYKYTYHSGDSSSESSLGYVTFGDYKLYDNPYSYQAFTLVYKEGTSSEVSSIIIDDDSINYDAQRAIKNSYWSSMTMINDYKSNVRVLFANPNNVNFKTTEFQFNGYYYPVNEKAVYIEPEEGHNVDLVYVEAVNPALSFAIILYSDGSFGMDEWTRCFNDVLTNGWYYEAVMANVEYGIMSGYGNGTTFGTSDPLKRQDFVCMIANLIGDDVDAYQNKTPAFRDIQKGSYYAGPVNWAVDNGIISGYQNGKFGVGDSITREQVCTILYRIEGNPAVSNINGTLAKFPDQNRISPFAREAVAWAVQQGIMNGMSNGTISSTTTASRAQIAAIMLNYIKAFE